MRDFSAGLEIANRSTGSLGGSWKCITDRMFLMHMSHVSPPIVGVRRHSNYARVSFQDLREILRKRRARHHDVRSGFLRLLLEFTLYVR